MGTQKRPAPLCDPSGALKTFLPQRTDLAKIIAPRNRRALVANVAAFSIFSVNGKHYFYMKIMLVTPREWLMKCD